MYSTKPGVFLGDVFAMGFGIQQYYLFLSLSLMGAGHRVGDTRLVNLMDCKSLTFKKIAKGSMKC